MKILASAARALAVVGLFAVTTPVMAQEIADIHAQRRERGHICFTDHFHYGSSSGLRTKRAAQAAAIRSWADFVDFEYGRAWTSWGASGSKQISCSNGGGSWGCDVSSRPCR